MDYVDKSLIIKILTGYKNMIKDVNAAGIAWLVTPMTLAQ